MPPTHRFLEACHRRPVDRLPVWMMRQAGRYQPSYRAVRQQVGFLELCRSPELIAKVSCAPIDEFGFDAAILFSDILVHLPAYRAGTEKVAELRRQHPPEKVIPAIYNVFGLVDLVTVDRVL